MRKSYSFITLVPLLLITTLSSYCQQTYEPLHSVTGYDYFVPGELELEYQGKTVFKELNTAQDRSYHIVSPVILHFNLNDLIYFKAQPEDFTGYVENHYDAQNGFSGGLIDILYNGTEDGENWMMVDEHIKTREGEEVREIKVKGEAYPVIQIHFSIPDYPEAYKSGLEKLLFRIAFSAPSDLSMEYQRNISVEYNSNSENASDSAEILIDEETIRKLEAVDPALAEEMRQSARILNDAATFLIPGLSLEVGCGTFFGLDLAEELVENNLVEASEEVKDQFSIKFEKNYFSNMPVIPALPLINFLISAKGVYEIPFSGSFASDSGSGTETAYYKGRLVFDSKNISKE